jgi:hypothetical protein
MPERALDVSIDQDLLMQGLAETSEHYQVEQAAHPDVVIHDVLGLTEDVSIITASAEFATERKKGYVETQYALDATVGTVVAQELSSVINTPGARKLLPDKAVAIIEVNANRGFMPQYEDRAGCYGLQQGHLGHVVIDAYFAGPGAVNYSRNTQDVRIDPMSELGSFPNPLEGLPRNAARILVRPSYPLLAEISGRASPREIFLARLNPNQASDRVKSEMRDENIVIRGEYRFCRVVSLLHDLTDWQPQDFESLQEASGRRART